MDDLNTDYRFYWITRDRLRKYRTDDLNFIKTVTAYWDAVQNWLYPGECPEAKELETFTGLSYLVAVIGPTREEKTLTPCTDPEYFNGSLSCWYFEPE